MVINSPECHLNIREKEKKMNGWNGSGEDWLHGDENLTDEAYPPVSPEEIEEALADIKLREEKDNES